MLTSIGRAAARRVLAGAAPTKLPLASRSGLALRPALSARSFAASAWARSPPAAAGTAAEKTAAVKKTKKAPAAKKKTTAVKKKKKTAVKKKPVVKKKAKAKKPKPVPKKKPKKTLSPEEKEKAMLRDTKKLSLLKDEPVGLPGSSWLVYIKEHMTKGAEALGTQMGGISASYKALSTSELEALKSTATANKVTNKENHAAWVRSHPPEAIYLANVARARLARRLKKRASRLIDERLPKHPQNGYSIYVKSRYADIGAGVEPLAAFGAIAQEWKVLSEAEQQSFRDRAATGQAQAKDELEVLKTKAKKYLKETGLTF